MQPAIRVENLAKRYRVSHAVDQRAGYKTLREGLADLALAPLRRMRALRHGSSNGRTEDFWALKDVSFEVWPSDVIGIIGPNGAGKSTLLKILSHITKPTQGKVELRGRVASLLEVGTGFHPELTGRENIFLNGSILGMGRLEIRSKFDEIVDFSGIERFLDTPVKRYSSGMYVRLAFAVAAHLTSEILIIDEVLAVGDAQFQKKCLGRMEHVAKDGRTVLFVSHNMPAVRTLCSRCVVMEQGRVAQSGNTEECIHRYLSQSGGEVLRPQASFDHSNGEPLRMTAARLTSAGATSSMLQMGAPLALEVHFESDQLIQHPAIGFIISTADGEPVLNANTHYQQPLTLPTPSHNGVIRCDLGVVPLMADKYFVSLWFGDQLTNHHVVQNALSFEVVERDVWGTSKVPPKNCSHLWWPTKFRCSPADGERA